MSTSVLPPLGPDLELLGVLAASDGLALHCCCSMMLLLLEQQLLLLLLEVLEQHQGNLLKHKNCRVPEITCYYNYVLLFFFIAISLKSQYQSNLNHPKH